MRYDELLACFLRGAKGHCAIVDSDTTWEGVRWTETHANGDKLVMAQVTIPMHTQFLVCEEHLPEEEQ